MWCVAPFSGARARLPTERASIIQALKFGGRQNLARLLGPLLASTFAIVAAQEIDIIVPVPLHQAQGERR
jgi:predicted amidophosphoribosyltransferase